MLLIYIYIVEVGTYLLSIISIFISGEVVRISYKLNSLAGLGTKEQNYMFFR